MCARVQQKYVCKTPGCTRKAHFRNLGEGWSAARIREFVKVCDDVKEVLPSPPKGQSTHTMVDTAMLGMALFQSTQGSAPTTGSTTGCAGSSGLQFKVGNGVTEMILMNRHLDGCEFLSAKIDQGPKKVKKKAGSTGGRPKGSINTAPADVVADFILARADPNEDMYKSSNVAVTARAHGWPMSILITKGVCISAARMLEDRTANGVEVNEDDKLANQLVAKGKRGAKGSLLATGQGLGPEYLPSLKAAVEAEGGLLEFQTEADDDSCSTGSPFVLTLCSCDPPSLSNSAHADATVLPGVAARLMHARRRQCCCCCCWHALTSWLCVTYSGVASCRPIHQRLDDARFHDKYGPEHGESGTPVDHFHGLPSHVHEWGTRRHCVHRNSPGQS